jgi:hypothetical protein
MTKTTTNGTSEYLSILPDAPLPDGLAADLRDAEERILSEVKGKNMRELQAAYRWACWRACRGAEPYRIAAFPARSMCGLTGLFGRGTLRDGPHAVTPKQYTALMERLEATLRNLAAEMKYEPWRLPVREPEASWRPLTKQLEINDATGDIRRARPQEAREEADDEAERARRTVVYAERFGQLEQRFGSRLDLTPESRAACRRGPAARVVWDVESQRMHPSIRRAAKSVNANAPEMRKAIKRAMLRDEREFEFAGRRWRCGDGPAEPRPSSIGRPVRCASRPDVDDFASVSAAAAFFGLSKHKLSDALDRGDGTIDCLSFEYAGESARAGQPTSSRHPAALQEAAA